MIGEGSFFDRTATLAFGLKRVRGTNRFLTGEANLPGLLVTTSSSSTIAANSRKPEAPFANSATIWAWWERQRSWRVSQNRRCVSWCVGFATVWRVQYLDPRASWCETEIQRRASCDHFDNLCPCCRKPTATWFEHNADQLLLPLLRTT